MVVCVALLSACLSCASPNDEVANTVQRFTRRISPDLVIPTSPVRRTATMQGIEVTWSFDTDLAPQAYVQWLANQADGEFTTRTVSPSEAIVTRHVHGDAYVAEVAADASPRGSHVAVSLRGRPD